MGIRNSFTEKEVKKILKALGCYYVREGKGSHEVRFNPATEKNMVLAFHGNKPMKEGTLRSILYNGGIEEDYFLRLAGKIK